MVPVSVHAGDARDIVASSSCEAPFAS